MAEGGDGRAEEEVAAILLYYKYAPVADVPALVRFYDSNCRSLGLLGRVRIAQDGVNVTVGGKMSCLEKHIAEVKLISLFEGTDFKLACCEHPTEERVAKECGFTSLSIRVVKELVTFRSDPLLKSPEISNAGRHLSANEFHSVLHDARSCLDSEASIQQQQLVLLDARNVYETRIGKFQAPNVETLDPEIRQFSDLSAWIDEHSDQLQGKSVLMYCTGGIRCESASAYIRSKGAGFENVFQLFGGIQRYLEQFPDGGYFKGKNFVFDHRISVGSQDANVLGTCLICSSSFDDYSSRCRCTYCRMLVLVCYECQDNCNKVYICELCKRHGKGGKSVPLIQDSSLHPELLSETAEISRVPVSDIVNPLSELSRRYDNWHARKLRILCLHGFRQNASNFKGRTSALAKKLKNIVEFAFIDAPHELPFIYQQRSNEPNQLFKDSSLQQNSELAISSQNSSQPQEKFRKRFAWLIASKSNCKGGHCWKMADTPFDPLQYQQQTDGFEESYAYLKTAISQMGPFDGVLGFSQGAAMATLFCEQQQRDKDDMDLRFAILCSGFLPLSEEFSREPIKLPSLHCFGSCQGQDRQIACETSRKLADLFDRKCSVIIEHNMGHIIPTHSPYIDQMKEFLLQFL